MNVEPQDSIRVPHEAMQRFVLTAAQTVGLPAGKAELLARLLTENDLRGVFSHGTQQIATYAILMRDGILNHDPQIKIVNETPASVTIDGDGGLGYFPAYEGTAIAIAKAKATGMAVMVSRNHGHFGAAGIYSRMTLDHDLMTFVTSGAQLGLAPGGHIYGAGGGSPMSFSAPTQNEAPLVLDFGTMHDLYASSQHRDDIARLVPGMVFRSLGLGAICQAWGGLLTGLAADAERSPWKFAGANQGALLMTFRIDLFADPQQLKHELDRYVQKVHQLRPLEGFAEALLPIGPEANCEIAYRKQGIPVGLAHRERLEQLATELAIAVPW